MSVCRACRTRENNANVGGGGGVVVFLVGKQYKCGGKRGEGHCIISSSVKRRIYHISTPQTETLSAG